MALTQKQRRFVEEYLKVLNATEAARRAGYSTKTAYQIGYENLRKPEIQEAIQTWIDSKVVNRDLFEYKIIEKLSTLSFEGGKPSDQIKAIEVLLKVLPTVKSFDFKPNRESVIDAMIKKAMEFQKKCEAKD